ncbi:MAG: leucine-rich repeat domain-containing protein, partial [Clostridia bacterium]|nr:leucine-rich repeat domain-containing protein [Clostridia bacterium]
KRVFSTMLALICASCLFAGCGPNLPSLEKPQRLRVNNDIVMWEGVENATEYVIVVNGQEYKTDKLYFDLSFLTSGSKCNIEIYAIGEEGLFTASPTTSITTTIVGKPVETPTKALMYNLLPDGSGYEVTRSYESINDFYFGDFSGLEGRVVIPDTYNGLPVKKIASEGIGRIPGEFENLQQSITANSVTTSVRLPSMLEEIGDAAFHSCYALTKVEFPDSLRRIGYVAFSNCEKLMDIRLPESLEFLDYGVFNDTAWWNAHKTDEFMTLGHFLYKYNGDFEGDIDSSIFPQGIKYIIANAFQGAKIQSISLSEDVELIGESTFSWCSNLKFVSIASMKKVYSGTFERCTNLETVVLPQGLTKIDWSAFNNCTALKNIYFKGTEEEFSAVVIGNGNEAFTSTTAYFYSQNKPTKAGNYWHYAEDGKTPIIW